MLTVIRGQFNEDRINAEWRFDTDAVKKVYCTVYLAQPSISKENLGSALYKFICKQALAWDYGIYIFGWIC